ncbi:MAG: hypothetical protein IKQ33_01655 [Clostridia bacterium]|nr:hypothetical protein [Clostridia bacterium]
MKVNDVVQFNENHKWCGCLGIVTEVKDCGKNGIRYQVVVEIPQEGSAYIFVMSTENALELIGTAVMVPRREQE